MAATSEQARPELSMPLIGHAAFHFLHVFLPIFVGGMVYLMWRPVRLTMFQWAKTLHLYELVLWGRALCEDIHPPSWVLFALPDGVWVYSMVCFFGWLFRDGPWLPLLLWCALGPVLGLGSELGQLIGWVPGTYAEQDMIAYSLGTVLGGLVVFFLRRAHATPRPQQV